MLPTATPTRISRSETEMPVQPASIAAMKAMPIQIAAIVYGLSIAVLRGHKKASTVLPSVEAIGQRTLAVRQHRESWPGEPHRRSVQLYRADALHVLYGRPSDRVNGFVSCPACLARLAIVVLPAKRKRSGNGEVCAGLTGADPQLSAPSGTGDGQGDGRVSGHDHDRRTPALVAAGPGRAREGARGS